MRLSQLGEEQKLSVWGGGVLGSCDYNSSNVNNVYPSAACFYLSLSSAPGNLAIQQWLGHLSHLGSPLSKLKTSLVGLFPTVFNSDPRKNACVCV